MSIKCVLVTGGAGFIGSHVCDELIAHGYDVRVLDNLDSQVHGRVSKKPPEYLNPAVEFNYGTVCDRTDVMDCLDDVDAVIHLAAKVGVAQSMYEMAAYTFDNTYGTANLLEALSKYPIKKLIVASSMSVYGEGSYWSEEAQKKWDDIYRPFAFDGHWEPPACGETLKPIPTDESKPVDIQSIYALTKYDQEQMCLLFGRAYNVPTIALRFFNVYGTRQSLNNPYTGAMAIFASRLLNGKPPIIYEDGQQRRDFVNVKDVVRGIRLALESDVSDEVINIGSGKSFTVLMLAQYLNDAMGLTIDPEITGQHRVGDIRHCFADISKARRLLGYEPQVSLTDGIAELVEWLKTQTAIDRVEEHRSELVEKGLLA